MAGLNAAHGQVGPTMLVVPDANLLGIDDYGTLTTAMLSQCYNLQDRVAIIDVWGAGDKANWNAGSVVADLITPFCDATAPAQPYYSYGMAYYPFLRTSMVQASEVDYTNLDLDDPATAQAIKALLTGEANRRYLSAGASSLPPEISGKIDQLVPAPPPQPAAKAAGAAPASPADQLKAAQTDLTAKTTPLVAAHKASPVDAAALAKAQGDYDTSRTALLAVAASAYGPDVAAWQQKAADADLAHQLADPASAAAAQKVLDAANAGLAGSVAVAQAELDGAAAAKGAAEADLKAALADAGSAQTALAATPPDAGAMDKLADAARRIDTALAAMGGPVAPAAPAPAKTRPRPPRISAS